ncbi:RICIN domain-containing protein [Streptomyces sp. NPDC058746]|uniref:RICIN domain-containing protein n=1 Tax=Streptomyces sp. NPDC058746 TaxID=3346622 RepID=UPI0036C58445
MLVQHLKKAAVVALAVPALTMTAVHPAATATNQVTWTDHATDGCMYWWFGPDGNFSVNTKIPSWNSGYTCGEPDDRKTWTESQSGLENSDGAWTISPGTDTRFCLASWYADANGVGSVYIEPCSSPRNYYQQWYEVKDGDRWRLVNRQTGLCLDSNSRAEGSGAMDNKGAVYTMQCNGGGNQRWY